MNEVYLKYDGMSGRWTLEGRELHCGECFEARLDGKWVGTRIEYSHGWYLVGLPENSVKRSLGDYLVRAYPR